MQSKTALCVPYRPYRISENPTFGGAEKTRPYFIAQLLNVTWVCLDWTTHFINFSSNDSLAQMIHGKLAATAVKPTFLTRGVLPKTCSPGSNGNPFGRLGHRDGTWQGPQKHNFWNHAMIPWSISCWDWLSDLKKWMMQNISKPRHDIAECESQSTEGRFFRY